ncbi:MAG: hypothetical protein O2971_02855 [Proteobacteria bacterium]|nr:hypothetical protein [Pseudomonadota bacterium]
MEETTFDSRRFLRHDLALLAVEGEIPLHGGYWGSVAAGHLGDGKAMRGRDIILAESPAGPIQILMRIEADVRK